MDEQALVKWYKELFRQRTTNPQSVLDVMTDCTVGWSEVKAKMASLGFADNAVDMRLAWDAIWKRNGVPEFEQQILAEIG
jgi:hypothetical protein